MYHNQLLDVVGEMKLLFGAFGNTRSTPKCFSALRSRFGTNYLSKIKRFSKLYQKSAGNSKYYPNDTFVFLFSTCDYGSINGTYNPHPNYRVSEPIDKKQVATPVPSLVWNAWNTVSSLVSSTVSKLYR